MFSVVSFNPLHLLFNIAHCHLRVKQLPNYLKILTSVLLMSTFLRTSFQMLYSQISLSQWNYFHLTSVSLGWLSAAELVTPG